MRHIRAFIKDSWRYFLLAAFLLWLVGCAVTGSEDVWFELPSFRLDPDYVSEQLDIRCDGKLAICQSQSVLGDQRCTCYR